MSKRSRLFIFYFLTGHLILHVLANESRFQNIKNDSLPFNLYIQRLKKALCYMEENIADLNVDAYFGIFLTYMQLNAMSINDESLDEIRLISKRILNEQIKSNHTTRNIYLNNIQRRIMKEEIWKDVPIDKNSKLPCLTDINVDLKHPVFSKSFISDLLLNTDSSPNENQSDMCLSELLGISNMNKNTIDDRNDFQCRLSNKCNQIMTLGTSRGYSSTHRLLFWLICQISGCQQCNGKNFNIYMESLCCNIVDESLMIEKARFPTVLQDLFMEQSRLNVVLCTLSGFRDVMLSKWIRKVFKWQRPAGCWGYTNEYIRNTKRRYQKRSTTTLGPQFCSSHETSLGIVLLSLAVRQKYASCYLNE